MHQKFYILILLFSTILSKTFGQIDSIALSQESLTELDLFPHKAEKKNAQVISLFGEEEEIKDLPYTAYVITKEEIRENGYVTLTDALQTIPGIFVSPLGSAMEGELFTMSGLRGNRYTEIMINGMSIKPQASPGMPLGAQIPVRQAERIEVIYGPGKANIGYGANAGIINIVMKDSERPVFTQADVSVGGNGYNSLDIMFGGKLGRGKKLVKFSAWASSTSFNDWNIGFPEDSTIVGSRDVFRSSIYNPYGVSRGLTNFPYLEYPTNYVGSVETTEKANFSHVSRQLGVRLQYRRLELWIDNRYRKDHSALGMSPTSVSYSFRDDFTAETMNRIGLRLKEGKGKWKYSGDVSLLIYGLDPLSSSRPIFNYADYGLLEAQKADLEEEGVFVNLIVVDSLVRQNQEEHFSGKRFRFAFGALWQTNQQLSYQVLDKWKIRLSFGLMFEGLDPDGYRDYYKRPVPVDNDLIGNPTFREIPIGRFYRNFLNYDGNRFVYLGFGNDFYIGKLKGYVGGHLNQGRDRTIVPRLFLSYPLNKKNNLYANFSQGFNDLSGYHRSNTFANLNLGGLSFVNYYNNRLKKIITSRVELGYRVTLDANRHLAFNAFAAKTQNVMRFGFEKYNLGAWEEDKRLIGYINSQGDFVRMAGVQGLINLRKAFLKNTINLRFAFQVYLSDRSFDNPNLAILSNMKVIEDYPRTQIQFRLLYKFKEKWSISTECFIAGEIKSGRYRPFGFSDDFSFTTGGGSNAGGYLLADIMARYKLSRNFALYIKVQNLLNSHYAGITASETPDALLYNVQPLRRFRIGINYDLE